VYYRPTLLESKFNNEQNVWKKLRKQQTCKAGSTLFVSLGTDSSLAGRHLKSSTVT